MKSGGGCTIFRLLAILSVVFIFGVIDSAGALDLSDVPLELQIESAPPILVFVLDSSAIADSELITPDQNGLHEDLYYLFPDPAYQPAPDHVAPQKALAHLQRRNWKLQWHGYNRLFYNPSRTYLPWRSTRSYTFHDADLDRPFSNPTRTTDSAARVEMTAPFLNLTIAGEHQTIPVAHYFTVLDTNGNGCHDDGEAIYLTTWTDADFDNSLDTTDSPSDQRRYYRLRDDGDHLIEDGELLPLSSEQEKDLIRPALNDESGRMLRFKTDLEDLQNFVNWFSYHRRRLFVLKDALASAIVNLRDIQVGIYASNGDLHLEALPVKITGAQESGASLDQSQSVLDALYAVKAAGRNRLRDALDQVGRYFHQQKQSTIGKSPFWSAGNAGACQHAYAVIIAASYRDDDFSGIGNVDGNWGRPFGDRWEDTLADIAMHYHENDIAPDLTDLVPAVGCDTAAHQHLVTCGLSFGVGGTAVFERLDQNTDPGKIDNPQGPCADYAAVPDWPFPDSGSPATIDDLWHAAVNSRGLYAHAHGPQELYSALGRFADHFERASLAAAGEMGHSTTTIAGRIAFQTRYSSEDWSGDVVAYPADLQSENQAADHGAALWYASEQLERRHDNWDRRRIITYGGTWQDPQGIPFRYELLSDGQREALGSDLAAGSTADQKARRLLDYLRGRSDPAFRQREHVLGDIVHSLPVEVEETVFVGANDGMLHAFDAVTGNERFAYIPNLIMDQVHHLGENDYTFRHRFYVDGEIFADEVMTDEFERQMLLVGGLGKGGKGYFCLRIGSRKRPHSGNHVGPYERLFSIKELSESHSENDFAKMLLWEYPMPEHSVNGTDDNGNGATREMGVSDRDMGYSFGQAYVVNANAPQNQYRPAVIFGNGYGSQSGHAVLYILDGMKGRVIRKIDTGAGDDNGLSTPALIDINMDRTVDYAYAGDLKGNLWKFDLTSSNPERWGVAYGQDRDRNGIMNTDQGDEPLPLMRTAGQAITARPDVMRMRSICAAQASGFMVVFGTGQYLTPEDRSDLSQQSIYGIWDYGDDSDDSEHLGSVIDHGGGLSSGLRLKRRIIAGESILDGQAVRELSGEEIEYSFEEDTVDGDGSTANNQGSVMEPNPQKNAGWFLDFPIPPDPRACPGERVTSSTLIRGGKVILNSFAPLDEPCRSGDVSWIYYLDGCNGNPVKDQMGEFILPWRHESRIRGVMVQKSERQFPLDQMVLIDQGGKLITRELIGEKPGRVYWRQN